MDRWYQEGCVLQPTWVEWVADRNSLGGIVFRRMTAGIRKALDRRTLIEFSDMDLGLDMDLVLADLHWRGDGDQVSSDR